MKNLKYQIKSIKEEIECTNILSKLNSVRSLIADEMEKIEDYKSLLDAKNDVVASYAAKQNLEYNFVLQSVINAVYTDVEGMYEEIGKHYENATKEIEKASSENFGEESDNA
ncbi:hypothetical protein RES5_004275 [Staphylococcus haemolyticus]|uniref:hypothetical protein n=1 Tax=Staphylococcus haemolyticus TaxID=1283 RepID=UPI001374C9B5|nr:hypothetical protein [Staphylococcus haemolyticus]QUX18664.1 hypothetical protein RES7_004205 [Staphylococcus haemolyticus]UCI00647.1 hypothetical protein RES5_004275 [Staphylococcus haemolyticus]UCI02871.1 hypothetical protein RES6_004260 [Staphylococcus haemolyticus]